MNNHNSTYQYITNLVIKKLEEGTVPWEKGWADGQRPTSYSTGETYKGINALMLSMMGFSSKYWITKKQMEKEAGKLKDGVHPYDTMPVIKWQFVDDLNRPKKELVDGKTVYYQKGIMLQFEVYNLSQTTVTPPADDVIVTTEHDGIYEAEALIADYKRALPIRHEQQRAFYMPSADYVNMPKMNTFTKQETYYTVLFHELTHSTGHSTRLNREGVTSEKAHFGNQLYSKEELIAEMGACFLSSLAGIEKATIDNSASYIQSWIKALRNDKTMLITAGGQAQKAVDYIINYKCSLQTALHSL